MLIGLTGNKGVGKDTVGQYLVDNYGFTRIAFADKLKEAVANLFGISIQEIDLLKTQHAHCRITRAKQSDHQYSDTIQLLYWREFLQRFGTEMGRNTFGTDFWVDLWMQDFKDHQLQRVRKQEPINVVVTDVRFENEAARILAEGGYVLEITRPGHKPDGHASEDGLHEALIDGLIINNESIEDLYKDVNKLMEDIASGL